MDLRSKPKK